MTSKNNRNSKTFDIVVGIPSFNEAATIGFVAEMVSEGLRYHFPDRNSIIVNVDNDSSDNTRQAFMNARTAVKKKYISTAKGVRGKGHNFLNLFKYAAEVKAEVIIVVDADLRSITKEWIELLGRPVLEGHDLVTPLYTRHQFDGSITNHICYPVVFGLFSTDIRQPIGGDFAMSSKFIRHLLEQQWSGAVKQYGIDIFLTMNAILGDFSICQSALGKKVHNASAPKLGVMFEQVMESLLDLLVANRNKWSTNGIERGHIEAPKIYGDPTMPEPQELEIDVRDLKEKCTASYREYLPYIQELLGPYAVSRIENMFRMDFYNLDVLLWTQIFYNLVYKYDKIKDPDDKKKIINTLKPLYFARSLTFNYNTWKYNIRYAEEAVREQALGFATQRYYLWGLYGCPPKQ